MKHSICTTIGTIGAIVAGWFGGWDKSLIALVTFMIIDYFTGIIVAGIFKKSTKTKNGKLSSKIGYKGLCKKGMILLFVLIGNQLDMVVGSNYIRDAVCIGFMANELLSIAENAKLMGVPLPKIIDNAIELLKNKEEK
jgi:toxin secretion/phage lysis holin